MKNRYVFTSASWVTGAFNKVAKTAGEVGQQTKEKVEKAEDEKRRKMVDDFAEVHLSDSPTEPESNDQHRPSKPAPVTAYDSNACTVESRKMTKDVALIIHGSKMSRKHYLNTEENVVAIELKAR